MSQGSLAGSARPTRSHTIEVDEYDHEITLRDATKPTIETSPSPADPEQAAGESDRRGSSNSLGRRGTKSTLREELARRRYAKFQESRYKEDEQGEPVSNTPPNGGDTDTSDDAAKRRKSSHEGRFRDRLPFRSRKVRKLKQEQDYEVDILYENQRGSFFCGIPLYSSKSLLNFDPGPWQNAAHEDSPVNITNAQVPDPTWAWAWKSWYVDMSHDVDEEGWEYSLSFRQGFSWHGSHPWFHSFVRRRRWLRKRIRIHPMNPQKEKGRLKNAHMLNADYFTIHASKDRSHSRSPSFDGLSTKRSSYSGMQVESETDIDQGDITNILELMKVLKRATMDRAKIEAVQSFLEHGGDELFYLPDHMPEVMSMFLYQTSRQQCLREIRKALNDKPKNLQVAETLDGTDDEAVKRRADSIQRAVEVAEDHIKNIEYWSEAKERQGGDRPNSELKGKQQDRLMPWKHIDAASDIGTSEVDDGDDNRSRITDVEIKGIPEEAHVDEEPGINWHFGENDGPEQLTEKGKEKAV
jgi:hypothetical protein